MVRWLLRLPLIGLAVCLISLSSGCSESSQTAHVPPPQTMIPEDAVGHYCGMFLFEHKGPKGQILLRDQETPVWFTTIREVFAYLRLPEEPKAIAAVYVQDMTHMLPDGSFPEDAWIDARAAWYVIHSRHIGGMGALDAIPFGTRDAAVAFQEKEGGEVVSFDAMPDDYIFGLPEAPRDVRQSSPTLAADMPWQETTMSSGAAK